MEVSTMPIEGITAIVSQLGVVGVLVWYLYHNTTATIPGITKQYTESQEKVSAKFAETQEGIAKNFADMLQQERTYRKQEIEALQQWIKKEASCKYNADHN